MNLEPMDSTLSAPRQSTPRRGPPQESDYFMSNEITQAPGEHGWAWLVLVLCARMHPRGSQSILWSYEHVLAAHGMLRARVA